MKPINILDTKITNNHPIHVCLSKVYGLGHSSSVYIVKRLGLSLSYRIDNLTPQQIKLIESTVKKLDYKINLDLLIKPRKRFKK